MSRLETLAKQLRLNRSAIRSLAACCGHDELYPELSLVNLVEQFKKEQSKVVEEFFLEARLTLGLKEYNKAKTLVESLRKEL